jgi:hypothetical protein
MSETARQDSEDFIQRYGKDRLPCDAEGKPL